jgi:ABC-type Mn2+/Zn2+ transport system ATPase subunit
MDRAQLANVLIGIVGPCGAGKSTLVAALENLSFKCRHIAQEHSYVPYMWKRISNPDVLVFLNASFASCTARRKLSWNEADYEEQLRRLAHARAHADVVIETDGISAGEVLKEVLEFLGHTP